MDMLVRLYDLPSATSHLTALADAGVTIRVARAYERHLVLDWIRQTFSEGWASEAAVAFARQPVSCLIALDKGHIVGFACYEATCRGFFGPTGVHESHRKRGIGAALLMASLHAMADIGYAYAIIGSAGPTDFYQRICGAVPIENSVPGIYRDRIQTASANPTPGEAE